MPPFLISATYHVFPYLPSIVRRSAIVGKFKVKPEYRAVQMNQYEWLRGKPYSVTNEVFNFDTKSVRNETPWSVIFTATRRASHTD